ncbi:protein kinase domain-containing protein, partial [Mesorhizobium japonicum]|uniref:protein kinase domain-containing protein n=1 Tax=Mesorhizobium japonicum TaxID=2066070 RepID=UPI003B5CF035
LDRGAGAHVVALLDVAADDDRLTLVLPRLPGGDLARLLAQRTTLEGGEAVTILAPIAATVVRLHDAGVAHGALRAGSVLFDDDGAPVLTGFGSAAMFAPGAPEVERERVPEVAADRAALRAIASTVLDRVAGGRSAAAQRLRSEAAAASDADVAALLATRVFEVAAARPVRDADPVAAEAGGGLRIIPLAEPVAVADGEPDRNRMRRQGWAARVESWLDRSPVADAKAALV